MTGANWKQELPELNTETQVAFESKPLEVKPKVIITDQIKAEKYVQPIKNFRTLTITGYSQSPEEGTADGITADGTRVAYGVCAADPRMFSFGSILDIPGYGRCTVHDTGGAIIGNRIDAFFPNKQDAFRWGRRTLEVEIIRGL